MTDDLGRGSYELTADNSEALSKAQEVEAAFSKAGSSGNSAGLIAKGAMTAFAGAAGLATKGLVELDGIQAKFAADTGASAKEARDARDAILEMSSRNIQPMRDIGAVLTKVHTDLGLAGDQAEDAAERFLVFARATSQDASGAVSDFDDILDAWGLTIQDSVGLMDKLVLSHQKYGGSITANQGALAAMAPQLRALNLDIDDGIGLLNLFASSGLDAAAIPRALNTAIQNLNGKPLEAFVAELAAIEDPGERARRAVEVFGSKAGVALSNAIRPGMTSLQDFQVSATEAAGATERARDAIDGSFGSQVQLKIKQATAELIAFTDQFGPLLTGTAALASIGGALGLDKFVADFAKKMASAGKAGGEALLDGVGTVTGAAGTIIGNFFASRIESVIDPVRNSGLGVAYRAAGSKAATFYLQGLILGDVIGAKLSAAWVSVAGSGSIATKTASFAGKAAGFAFSLGVAAGVAQLAETVKGPLDDVAKQVHDTLSFLPDIKIGDGPNSWQWPLGNKNAPDWARMREETNAGVETGLSGAEYVAIRAGERASRGYGEGVESGEPAVKRAWGQTAGPTSMAEAAKRTTAAAEQAARDATKAHASTIRNGWDSAEAAWDALVDAMKDPMSRAKRIAKLEGRLSSDRLSEGLRSNDPLIRADSEAMVAIITDELAVLKGETKKKGSAGGQALADGMTGKKGAVGTAAKGLVTKADTELDKLEGRAKTSGLDSGDAFTDGIVAGISTYRVKMRINSIAEILRTGSPPKNPENPLYGIEKWGYHTGEALVDPMARAIDDGRARVSAAWGSMRGVFGSIQQVQPTMPAAMMGGGFDPPGLALGLRREGDVTFGDIIIHLNAPGLDASDPRTIREVGRQLGQEVRLAMPRTPAAFARPNA